MKDHQWIYKSRRAKNISHIGDLVYKSNVLLLKVPKRENQLCRNNQEIKVQYPQRKVEHPRKQNLSRIKINNPIMQSNE